MKLRIVKGSVVDGQAGEAARVWRETVAGEMAGLPEFRHAFVGGDAGGSGFVVVTVWERFPDPAVSRQLLGGFEGRVRDLMAGPLLVEEFELLVEV